MDSRVAGGRQPDVMIGRLANRFHVRAGAEAI